MYSVVEVDGLTGGEVRLVHDLGPGGILELLVPVLNGGRVPQAGVAAHALDEMLHAGAAGAGSSGALTEPLRRARPAPAAST